MYAVPTAFGVIGTRYIASKTVMSTRLKYQTQTAVQPALPSPQIG